jgi:hypothetical protein
MSLAKSTFGKLCIVPDGLTNFTSSVKLGSRWS